MRTFPVFHRVLAGVFLVWSAAPTGTASAGSTSELPSVLVLAKSSNRNQVHYAVQAG